MTVPDWVQDAVFYQIFPDRFANGDPSNDPPNVQVWGAKPTIWDFQGGDLQGVIDHLDYLEDLGVNALYFNPIFQASSNHRYNTTNYYQIDPMLGSMDRFKTLLREVHRRGIRVILDGVFNHCGRGFFAFVDVLENQGQSPYLDWFHIKRFPLDAYTDGKAQNYLGWYELKSLPKLNTDNPEVKRYIFDIARYWIDQGIDGWRLDVPNEIDDDHFWSEFRQVVKQGNPDAYLMGEIWKINPRWVGPHHFDGLMNYPLRNALLDFIVEQKTSSDAFVADMERLITAYPREHLFAHFVPLGSHDTHRLATLLNGDLAKLKLFYLMLFSFPGAPSIYYGDEIGLEGGKDPDCRRAFPWNEQAWNQDLRDFIKQLIALRHEKQELRRGEVRFLPSGSNGIVMLARSFNGSSLLTVLNGSGGSNDFRLPVGELGWPDQAAVGDLLTGLKYVVSDGGIGLHLAPYQGLMLAAL